MSHYIYGYILGSKYTGSRAQYRVISQKMIALASASGMYVHVGALPVPPLVSDDLFKRIGQLNYYDHMPFLLVEEPFDDTSSELVNREIEKYIHYGKLREGIQKFCEGMTENICTEIIIISETGYTESVEPAHITCREALVEVLNKLFPDTFMPEGGEFCVTRYENKTL